MDNYNYPLGADTDNAPWNQPSPQLRKRQVSVTQTLSRKDTVECADDADLVKEWQDYNFPIETLLKELQAYAQRDLESETEQWKKIRLLGLIQSCQGWEVEDTIVEEE